MAIEEATSGRVTMYAIARECSGFVHKETKPSHDIAGKLAALAERLDAMARQPDIEADSRQWREFCLLLELDAALLRQRWFTAWRDAEHPPCVPNETPRGNDHD